MIALVGLSFKTAPIEVREALAVPKDTIPQVLQNLVQRPGLGEVMLVSTCNRVEVFAAPGGNPPPIDQLVVELEAGIEAIATMHGSSSVSGHLYRKVGDDAVKHLFRVASSLDSLVIGEPQILGQVKESFETARDSGTIGPMLSRIMDRALHTAKRVRSETAIGAGSVSVSSVAVDLAQQIFGSLADRKALLVGAGQMAESAAQHLSKAGASIRVINRSFEKASLLAKEMDGVPLRWDELSAALTEVDVVISSTSSRGYVLTHEILSKVSKMRRGKELFLIDIAVPRDIEPTVQSLDGVFLHNVDDLEAEVRSSMKVRAAEAEKAEQIVATEVKQLESWAETRSVTPTLIALRNRTRSILHAELERSLSGKLKHLGPAEKAALEAMMEAAAAKLLHAPITHIKRQASEPGGDGLIRTVRDMFELPDVDVVQQEKGSPSKRITS